MSMSDQSEADNRSRHTLGTRRSSTLDAAASSLSLLWSADLCAVCRQVSLPVPASKRECH